MTNISSSFNLNSYNNVPQKKSTPAKNVNFAAKAKDDCVVKTTSETIGGIRKSISRTLEMAKGATLGLAGAYVAGSTIYTTHKIAQKAKSKLSENTLQHIKSGFGKFISGVGKLAGNFVKGAVDLAGKVAKSETTKKIGKKLLNPKISIPLAATAVIVPTIWKSHLKANQKNSEIEHKWTGHN